MGVNASILSCHLCSSFCLLFSSLSPFCASIQQWTSLGAIPSILHQLNLHWMGHTDW